MYKKLIFIAIVFFTLNACKKTFDPGTTKAAKVANEWWANLYKDGQPVNSTFAKIETYNTATNNDSIWIDDLGNLWNFKIKAKFDATSLTFQATNAVSKNYLTPPPGNAYITVTITEAKIMPLAAKSTTGVPTDSIYFKVVFSDDAATTYEIKGTGRTRWSPDDY